MILLGNITVWPKSLPVQRKAATFLLLAAVTGFTSCAPSPENPGESTSPSNGETSTGGLPDSTTFEGTKEESGTLPNEVGVPEACHTFCHTQTRCFPDEESHEACTAVCIDDAMASIEGAQNREGCSAAFVDFWFCQAAMKCEDIGGESCTALDHKIEALCFGSEDPEANELPGHRLFDACTAMCDRVVECESKTAAPQSSDCIFSCMSVAQGKIVSDPVLCLSTALAWARCRTALECDEVVAEAGCEEEKHAIACDD